MTARFSTLLPLAIAGALFTSGCTPKYPKCSKDEHCRPGERCVNGLCQQCRDDSDCPAGQECQKGRCQARKVAAARCRVDSDCPAGQECHSGVCVAPPGPQASAAPCTPEPVYFDYDESILTSEATAILKGQVDSCLKKVPARKVRVEGHCDPRGTEEYNLALGEKRAQSVKRYLQQLGHSAGRLRTVSKGKLEATGTEESSWARDRRAQFFWE